jgi:hypothetical protein
MPFDLIKGHLYYKKTDVKKAIYYLIVIAFATGFGLPSFFSIST